MTMIDSSSLYMVPVTGRGTRHTLSAVQARSRHRYYPEFDMDTVEAAFLRNRYIYLYTSSLSRNRPRPSPPPPPPISSIPIGREGGVREWSSREVPARRTKGGGRTAACRSEFHHALRERAALPHHHRGIHGAFGLLRLRARAPPADPTHVTTLFPSSNPQVMAGAQSVGNHIMYGKPKVCPQRTRVRDRANPRHPSLARADARRTIANQSFAFATRLVSSPAHRPGPLGQGLGGSGSKATGAIREAQSGGGGGCGGGRRREEEEGMALVRLLAIRMEGSRQLSCTHAAVPLHTTQ